MPPVFSRAQEVLASPVIGVFVQHPVALHDIQRGDVTGVETLMQIWAVIHELHILASKVGPLKDLHPVVPIVLLGGKKGENTAIKGECWIMSHKLS